MGLLITSRYWIKSFKCFFLNMGPFGCEESFVVEHISFFSWVNPTIVEVKDECTLVYIYILLIWYWFSVIIAKRWLVVPFRWSASYPFYPLFSCFLKAEQTLFGLFMPLQHHIVQYIEEELTSQHSKRSRKEKAEELPSTVSKLASFPLLFLLYVLKTTFRLLFETSRCNHQDQHFSKVSNF